MRTASKSPSKCRCDGVKVLIFGASGMVGQGALRECLLDSGVEVVTVIGRTPTGTNHPKLREIVHPDFWKYDGIAGELTGFDACFFCLGVSSSGMSEPDYERVTYGITLAAAEILVKLNPSMTFIYVSGAGTDSSEQGKTMWARVKGRTENAMLRLPFAGAYMFRPGIIQPLHGIQSKTASYRIFYRILAPLMGLLRWMLPNQVLSTELIGRAMLAVARRGFPKHVLESKDIRAAAIGN